MSRPYEPVQDKLTTRSRPGVRVWWRARDGGTSRGLLLAIEPRDDGTALARVRWDHDGREIEITVRD